MPDASPDYRYADADCLYDDNGHHPQVLLPFDILRASFGSQRAAVLEATGSQRNLLYLHGDHLGSTVMTTYSSNGSRQSERGYYAFGANRREIGAPLTDHLFIGQKKDDTGLYYYNARYGVYPELAEGTRRLATSSRRIPSCPIPCALMRTIVTCMRWAIRLNLMIPAGMSHS